VERFGFVLTLLRHTIFPITTSCNNTGVQ